MNPRQPVRTAAQSHRDGENERPFQTPIQPRFRRTGATEQFEITTPARAASSSVNRLCSGERQLQIHSGILPAILMDLQQTPGVADWLALFCERSNRRSITYPDRRFCSVPPALRAHRSRRQAVPANIPVAFENVARERRQSGENVAIGPLDVLVSVAVWQNLEPPDVCKYFTSHRHQEAQQSAGGCDQTTVASHNAIG